MSADISLWETYVPVPRSIKAVLLSLRKRDAATCVIEQHLALTAPVVSLEDCVVSGCGYKADFLLDIRSIFQWTAETVPGYYKVHSTVNGTLSGLRLFVYHLAVEIRMRCGLVLVEVQFGWVYVCTYCT